ncbi:MAG: pyruvate formate lyase family protein [Chloroflexota bacterium]
MTTALRPPAIPVGARPANATPTPHDGFDGPDVARGWSPRIDAIRQRSLTFEDGHPRGERLRLVTESYRQTEGEPAVLRRAKALAHVFAHNGIRVYPEDRLAGLPQRFVYHTEALHAFDQESRFKQQDFPEMNGGHFPHADKLSPEQQACVAWWQERPSVRSAFGALLSPEARRAIQLGVFQGSGIFAGHMAVNYRKALAVGLAGLKREARERLAAGVDDGGRQFLEAVQIACDAVIGWAHRYADLAERLAAAEPDAEQRREYRVLAEVCRRVPAEPPRTFREAVQAVWFLIRGMEMEEGDVVSLGISVGRLDQVLYPYYAADLAAGRTTRQEARELLEEFYLKFHRPYSDAHIMVGGLKEDGPGAGVEDGTNDLSYEILDIAQTHQLLIDLGARVHKGSPRAFLRKCAEVSACNIGFSLFGDEAAIAAFERVGVPREDAVRYTIVGCIETIIPGVAAPRTMEYSLNLDKCLELALNEGRCRLTGEQLGPHTGDPRRFTSFEPVMDAFRRQVAYFVELATGTVREAWRASPDYVPVPFLSATWDDCIANARDLTEGGARINASGVNDVGISTAADSLAALKALIFDQQSTDLPTLLDALDQNWEGFYALRERARRAPKFGNADPYVDAIAREVALAHYQALEDKRTLYGGRFWRLIFAVNVTSALGLAGRTAASADGRRAQDPIGISMSPSAGQDVRGPYAALDSVLTLDQTAIPGGCSYIMELDPAYLRSDDGSGAPDLEQLTDLIQHFVQHEGVNLAINVLNPDELRAAMALPGQYGGPAARMYGQSLYFAQMDRRLQEFLASRADRRPTRQLAPAEGGGTGAG